MCVLQAGKAANGTESRCAVECRPDMRLCVAVVVVVCMCESMCVQCVDRALLHVRVRL